MAHPAFPSDRYKLALIEPLLGNLLYFDVDEVTMSIGIDDGNQCVLPFSAMGLGQLVELIPEGIRQLPLARLTYDITSEHWAIDLTHMPDESHDEFLPEPTINDGEVFQVYLPDCWGCFWFKMVDLVREGTSAKLGHEKETPGFEASKLSTLPHIPLQIIAGHLSKMDCLAGLILADPLVIHKLDRCVPWKTFSFPSHAYFGILGAFRQLRLLSRDNVEELYLSGDECDPYDPAISELLLQEFAKFFYGARLETVHVPHQHLALFRGPNEAIKKLKISAFLPSSPGGASIWSRLASLPVSNSTEIDLDCVEFGSEYTANPRMDLSPQQQQPLALKNLTKLSYDCWLSGPVPPFALIPNLRELLLQSGLLSGDIPQMNRLLFASFSDSRLRHLSLLELHTCAHWAKRFVKALVKVAPNVKNFKLVLETTSAGDEPSDQQSGAAEMLRDLLSPLKELRSLVTLSVYLFHTQLEIKVKDAINLFLEYKHVPAVKLGSISGRFPSKSFIRRFRRLEKLGKVIEVEADRDEHESDDDIGDVEDSTGSDDESDDEQEGDDMAGSNAASDDPSLVDESYVEFTVVVRDPGAVLPVWYYSCFTDS